jgi:AcrR family transcriptional regulator
METRQSILDAAMTIFADRGYRAATVRDICAAADVNIAAINYHFGDKAALYGEVLAYAYATLSPQPMPRLQDHSTATGAFEAWVHWYVDRMVGDHGQTVGRLMMHAMADPSCGIDVLADRGIQPVFDELRSMVRALASDAIDDDTAARFALGVVGQCLIYRSSTGLLGHVQGVPEQDVHAIAAHICASSIAAIEHAHRVRS